MDGVHYVWRHRLGIGRGSDSCPSPAGRPLSTDFGIFYAAGKLSSGGELARAYSLTALAHMQAALNDGHALRLPFSYPPYAAAALGLLARLPVPQAVALWTAANLAGFVAAGIIAVHRLPPRTRFLGILALVGCIPMVIATAQGENSGLVALGFTLALAGLEVPAGRADNQAPLRANLADRACLCSPGI